MVGRTDLKTWLVFAIFLFGSGCSAVLADVIYVDADATGLNDGTSWTDAFNYLQDALDPNSVINGDEIWVAQGIYRPDEDNGNPSGTGDRTATFQLISGVALYGGFPSGGGTWNERNPNIYTTILNGDLDDDDTYVNDPCDLLNEPSRSENSYHVVTGSGTDANTILDGFTITAGNANGAGWPNRHGGGMFNFQVICKVNRCTFVENTSTYGGAMCGNTDSDLHVSNCIFSRNAAASNGGGMDLYQSDNAVVANCTFSENVGITWGGGGMTVVESNSPTVINCSFISNTALTNNGGGLLIGGSSPEITNCLFVNNSAGYGGGLSNFNGSSPTITNCTISNNSATVSCGGINDYNDCNPIINNCILWENTTPQISDFLNCAATVNYSNIQGGWSGAGGNNINADPLFKDILGRLKPNSPCIDAGDNTAVPGGIVTDLDGNPRFIDDPTTSDTGNGTPPIVDMGSYEFQLHIYVDADADGLNNGTSWADAFNYLQDALADPSLTGPAEIWVAEGTHKPDEAFYVLITPGDRTATFQLMNDVAIYGGFPSGGGLWQERNPDIYQTILSGDLDGNDVDVSDPCDLLTEPSRAENSYHVVTGSGTDTNAILNGFTITGGNSNAPDWPNTHGGGMFNNITDCTVNKCKFVENSSKYGGAMWCGGSDLHISNCTFFRNAAEGGGGANFYQSHYPAVANCTFYRNVAEGTGGGMDFYQSNYPEVINCTFRENVGIIYGGGGINFNQSNSPTVTNCKFISNRALETGSNAGGLYNMGSSPEIINCLFVGNSADYGGGVSNIYSSSPTITNCTFRNNWASSGKGGLNDYVDCYPIITNCIFWGNTAPTYPQIGDVDNSEATVNYSDVQDGWSGAGGIGNIDADPLFWGTEGNLMSGSPCRNLGDPNGDYDGQTDIDGQPRVLEDRVDIGADELPPAIQNEDTGATYETIQQAIWGAFDEQTIVVQCGIYAVPEGTGIDFDQKAITLRSYNPNDPNFVAATIIDCNNSGRGVYFHSGESTNSVLDGFTITNGYSAEGDNGAIACYNSSPTISHCIIRNNYIGSGNGGGIYCANSVPVIIDSTIRDNSPNGIWLDADSAVLIFGTVRVISNDIYGEDSVHIDPNGILNLEDMAVFCDVSGTGNIEVEPGASATIDGNAIIDLSDPYDPNVRGTFDCKGRLIVKTYGQINNTKINITRASFEDEAYISGCEIHVNSNAPYGQVFAEAETSFVDVNIYADGDRYMDLDPSIFIGSFINVHIFVTITEGVGQAQGGLFECRGNDGLADVDSCDPNYVFFCQASPGTIPDCNLSTWTLEKLELIKGAKLNLTNRFPFQPPFNYDNDYNDVVYVKELILREGSVLNLSFNKLHYETLTMEPNAVIRNIPLLGFSMINITLDNHIEYVVRVTHNNHTDLYDPSYNRAHIERVQGQLPDVNGMMLMCTLEDEDPCSPTYQQAVNACAKGTFAKTSQDEKVAVEFEYMFTADPCGDAELVVYLSNDPELGENLVEVARIQAPAPGRPGSIGSNRFALFSGLFPLNGLDFIRGTYIELRLLGSPNASCLINNWDPRVNCIGICGDFNMEEPFPLNIVDIYDYLVLLAEFGLANPGSAGKACLDLISDGCVNNDDLLAWGTEELLNACGGSTSSSSMSSAGVSPITFSGSEPLLICGKPASGWGTSVPSCWLYDVDTDGICTEATQTNSNGRIVADSDGNIYQIDGYLGLIDPETQLVIIKPDVNDYESSLVRIGYNSGEGLLLSDAVFKPGDANIVYIVPVQVDPQDGNCPYMAAAKLQITGGGNYEILQLYGKNPATDPCQNNTITDCDGDLVYEPDVQNLHEIEIDYEGNLFVLSGHMYNENSWLLVYDEAIGNDSEVRLSLTETNIVGPTAMVVSLFEDKLYLASSTDGPNDLISEVYRFSIADEILDESDLVLNDILEINCPEPSVCESYPGMCDAELGYVSMITSMIEIPANNTLYVTGFTAPKFPDGATMSSYPYNQAGGIFTTPMLAEVASGAGGVIEAVTITNNDLVLPFSMVCTESVTMPEPCGGADLDGSGDIGLPDLEILVSYWLRTDCGSFNDCDGADLEPEFQPDGDVDMLDFAVLGEYWLETDCGP